MLSLGNTSIKDMYYGSIKIGSAYLGSTKVYSSVPTSTSPYLLFQFDNSSYRPSIRTDVGTWERISTSPNVWKFTCDPYVPYGVGDTRTGWARLFSDEAGSSGHQITQPCHIIGGGNLNDSDLINLYVAFSGSTGIKSISLLQFSQARNVSGLFRDCTNVESGALAMYNYLSSLPNIDSHADTFRNCGSNTQTGLAELAQIPVGWGGNLIPASTLMASNRVAYTSNNYTAWQIISNYPDWTNANGMYLFTQASVSSYAGVSMNRSRIPNPLNGLGTTYDYPLYFYPAFVQCSKIPGQTGNSVSWVFTTDEPNGNLNTFQSSTDMPGTLDYNTYGPFINEFGTYNSSSGVYFVFLVTNRQIWQWSLYDGMGFLYNTNFNTDAGLRYFF